MQYRIYNGDGGISELKKPISAHELFSEFLLVTILQMSFYEIIGGAKWLLHILYAFSLASRLIHPVSIFTKISDEIYDHGRLISAIFSWCIIGLTSLILVIKMFIMIFFSY